MAITMPTREQPRASGGSAGGAGIGQKLGAVIGGVAGAWTGGPVGAVKGAASGASMGGMLGGMVKPAEAQQVITPEDAPAPVRAPDSGGIQKRLNDIEEDPLFALQQAKAALPQIPTEQRAIYEPQINEALRIATIQQQQQQGIA